MARTGTLLILLIIVKLIIEENKIKFKEYVDKYIDNYATPTRSDLELIEKMEKGD